MSRIGKQPIPVPAGVEITMGDRSIAVKGPKGALTQSLHDHVTVNHVDGVLSIAVTDSENKGDRALWGLFQRLVDNMVTGVTKGFEKKLEMNGVGYKVAVSGDTLNLALGFSHPVVFKLPVGISAAVEKNIITISGTDKQVVGETAAQIRRLRKPEPYKGKGIKYIDEVIRRKSGKAAKASAK
ncbi:MAG: 50S ribosomal protein L6 [bacterium]|nr:50S ribosomal protein L6 [bacterium]